MLVNFRDIQAQNSKESRLKKNLFFRGGQLTDLTAEDKKILTDKFQIGKIYDFRGQEEVTTQPDVPLDGVNYENIDILASATSGNSGSLQDMIINATDIREAMMKTYESIVISESALEGYRTFLLDLLDQKQAVYFHCFAGKDRTGFAAALLLRLSGASDEEIMKDYLKTNSARKEVNQEIINAVKATLTEDQIEGLQIALTVDKNYLLHAREIMNKHFGSFEGYLREGLALEKDYMEYFQALYLNQKS